MIAGRRGGGGGEGGDATGYNRGRLFLNHSFHEREARVISALSSGKGRMKKRPRACRLKKGRIITESTLEKGSVERWVFPSGQTGG